VFLSKNFNYKYTLSAGLSPSAFSLFLKEQFFSLLATYLFSFSKRAIFFSFGNLPFLFF